METCKVIDKNGKEQNVLIGVANIDIVTGILTVPYDVTVIGESACEGNRNLRTVFIWENVVRIEPLAFNGCAFLEKVELNENIKEIGAMAFTGTKICKMDVPSDTKIHETAFDEKVKINRREKTEEITLN